MVARVVWWAWRRVAAGRDAVAVPVRMEVIRVRRVVVKDRCRAWTGCPARGPLANGAARAAVDRVAAWRSSVAMIQAGCSWRTRAGLVERRIAPVAGPAPLMVDFASRSAVSEPSQRHRYALASSSAGWAWWSRRSVMRQNSSGVVWSSMLTWYSITRTVRVVPPPDRRAW